MPYIIRLQIQNIQFFVFILCSLKKKTQNHFFKYLYIYFVGRYLSGGYNKYIHLLGTNKKKITQSIHNCKSNRLTNINKSN